MHQTQNKCTEENTNAHGFGHPSGVGGAVLPLVGYRNNRARLGRLRARPWHQDEHIATNLGEKPYSRASVQGCEDCGHGGDAGGRDTAHRPGSLRTCIVERAPTEGLRLQTRLSLDTVLF